MWISGCIEPLPSKIISYIRSTSYLTHSIFIIFWWNFTQYFLLRSIFYFWINLKKILFHPFHFACLFFLDLAFLFNCLQLLLFFLIKLFFFVRKRKKEKAKKKNYSLRKKVHVASFLRRSWTPSGGEAWVKKSASDEALNLANTFVHWFFSLSVWYRETLVWDSNSFISWIHTTWI
jgi:hypothetical protein